MPPLRPQKTKKITEKEACSLSWPCQKWAALGVAVLGVFVLGYGIKELFWGGPKTAQELIQECEAKIMYTPLADQSRISFGELKGLYLATNEDEEIYHFSARNFCRQNRTRAGVIDEQRKKLARSLKRQIKKLAFEEKTSDFQIHDLLHAGSEAYFPLKNFLIESCKAGKCSADDMKGVSYLHSLEGDYENMEAMAQQNCEKHGTNCTKEVALSLSGQVRNDQGAPIKGVTIEVLSDISIQTVTTDHEGLYRIDFPTYDFVKVRLKASKVGYSDGVLPLDIIQGLKEQALSDLDFVLNAPAKVVTLNNVSGEVVGSGAEAEEDTFIITTEWSRYEIPFDSFVHKNGTPFRGELDAFLFEFDKDTDLTQFMENDTFDEVVGYAGNLMKTFGMPYILFKTAEGETIHVLKSKPMLLRNKISEMKALETAQDKIYEPLTIADLQFLVNESNRLGGHPVDRNFLIEHQLVRFPAFWVFDQKKGVWENEGVRVVSVDGTVETYFYTINDEK